MKYYCQKNKPLRVFVFDRVVRIDANLESKSYLNGKQLRIIAICNQHIQNIAQQLSQTTLWIIVFAEYHAIIQINQCD